MSLFNNQVLLGTAMIVFCVLFHVAGLVLLANGLKRAASLMSYFYPGLQSMILLAIGMLAIIALHMAGALAWAFLYIQLEEFDDLGRALYFSVTTSTTLGYGDITLSPRWQLLSTFEAIAGLLLFGASTAFLIGLTKSLFNNLVKE